MQKSVSNIAFQQVQKTKQKNMKIFTSKKLTEKMLNKTGIRPQFREVRLKTMLAAGGYI